MKFLMLAVLAALAGCASTANTGRVGGKSLATQSIELWDARRERRIPLQLSFPVGQRDCTRTRPCPVAFVSPGYGLAHTDYSYIARALASAGYLVVAIQHDLPTDPALARTGDLFASRMPTWRRGAENLRFVRDTLSRTHTGYDWPQLVLIGHSNGGDLSALAVHESPTLAATLVTLDHRRHPLPRDASIRVLSLRGSDFEADVGVLPTPDEPDTGMCITKLADARHNDMNDHGPVALQSEIVQRLREFLEHGRCGA